jgi:hypothetical protein
MRSPQRDIVLVVRAFGQNVAALRPHLGRLDSELGSALIKVEGHVRQTTDLALFVCTLDRRLLPEHQPLDKIADRTRAMGGELIDVDAMGATEERRLREHILPRCEISARDQPTLLGAAGALQTSLGIGAAPAVRRDPPPRVRFQRGDAWHVGRLGRVTEDRVYIVTSAPLRSGERTVVEINAPSVSAKLPAVVLEDDETIAPGTRGFLVRLLADGARKQSDHNVLTWAKNRLASSGPLPQRIEHRIPLSWPARLRDQNGEYLITMRDVSHAGIFAEMPRVPEGSQIQVRVPFDLGDAPIELDVEVARVVDGSLAAQHGIPAGVGLRVRPSSRDTDRYPAFVSRVTQRALHHVLIGARQPRLDELLRHFSSVGYLATGCDDIRSLCQRALDDGRPPEVLLIDPGLSTPEAILQRIRPRRIPVLAIDGTPISARRLVDAALLADG